MPGCYSSHWPFRNYAPGVLGGSLRHWRLLSPTRAGTGQVDEIASWILIRPCHPCKPYHGATPATPDRPSGSCWWAGWKHGSTSSAGKQSCQVLCLAFLEHLHWGLTMLCTGMSGPGARGSSLVLEIRNWELGGIKSVSPCTVLRVFGFCFLRGGGGGCDLFFMVIVVFS